MPSTESLLRVKGVIAGCLKLGAGADIPDDMPLIGGEHDLDSLDVLLVVTSIEKEFGVSIPNEAVGRSAFASVATLADLVDAHRRDRPA